MNKKRSWRALTLILVAGISAFIGSACGLGGVSNIRQAGIVNGETGKRLDEYFSSLAEKGFSGMLLVVKNGEVIISQGYGAANRGRSLPNTSGTVFDVGSITKQFTAAAILKLEMQGKLDVNDPISKYLDDVPADKAGITIHQLLIHSAGFINNLGDDYEPIKREEFVRRAMQSPLRSVPGVRYNYSNIGYSLLGVIIEIVTQRTYERYLHDNLFEPAGLAKTGYKMPAWNMDEIANGYYIYGFPWGTPLDKAWDTDGPYWNLRAATGMLSTADDLYKWHLALEGDSILSAAAKEKLYKPHIVAPMEPPYSYGYGWIVKKTDRGTNVVCHNGSNKVFFADFRRYTDEGVVTIIISNNAGHSAEIEKEKLEELVFASN